MKGKFKCQWSDKTITIADCHSCKRQCLPPELIAHWINNDYESSPDQYGVTTILQCLRKSFYKRIKKKELLTPQQLWIFQRGHGFHEILGAPFEWNELKLSEDFGNFKIIGYLDAYSPDEKCGMEFKSTSTMPKSPEPEHVLQLQAYYTLAKGTLAIKKLSIIYASMVQFRKFDIPTKDIRDLLFERGSILHSSLTNLTLPPKEPTYLCKYCPYLMLCQMNLIDEEKKDYIIQN